MKFDQKNQNYFMRHAIKLASTAPYPFACVIVKYNEVIATGRSWGSTAPDPTAHAEVNAIRNACKKLDTRILDDCTLYCTCEPCPMCFTACYRAGIKHIIYGIDLIESNALFPWEMLLQCNTINSMTWVWIQLEWWCLVDEIRKLYK